MMKNPARLSVTLALALVLLPGGGARAFSITFSPGDVFVSLETGPVQWRLADGTLNRVLVGTVPGTGEGLAFDQEGNLYVARWCVDPWCTYTGDTVEKFNTLGQSVGRVGSGYDCAPHAIVFDAAGAAYVGQAGCTGAILKFPPGSAVPTAYPAAPDYQGSFWIDLAADQCTILYTSFGPNVKQFDVCVGVQRPDFNAAPLPGGVVQDLRVLPDGGVLVSSGGVIARLDASGRLVGSYSAPGTGFWAGLDLVGDGTFWAGSYETSDVCRFDLATGAVLTRFNTGTPAHTVVGVRVKR
jgi:outer membrane protein assembly factor BamB